MPRVPGAVSLATGLEPRAAGLDVRMLLAFTAIYLLWGATFLAIRIAVVELPPLFTAGVRFLTAGALLYAFMRLRGEPAQASGELQGLPHVSLRAGMALLYLIVGGSWLGFTAYVWLLARMPATRVASHAYVNPLVAVALGYLLAGEQLTGRMIVASAVVLMSVFLILTTPPPRAV